MEDGTFHSNESYTCFMELGEAHIEHLADDGTTRVLKKKLPLAFCEVLDASFMDSILL